MAEDWDEDAALLETWRAGDAKAGEALYDRHSDAITRFFENKVRSDAEDLIQQTFLALVRSRDGIRVGTSVRAFLLTIARNLLIDHLRKRSRRPQDAQALALDEISVAELEPGPSTMLAKRREQRLLLAALRAIPVEHQLALELQYWEGLNAAEIAAIVGISHSAMRSRMVKARKLLLAQVERLADSPQLRDSTLDGLEQWARELGGLGSTKL